jgi:hypothetical protein
MKNKKTYSKRNTSLASSFWLGDDFNTPVRTKINNTLSVNYVKLAATQRAISNFVNIVTGQQIPVVFQSKNSSYTDGKSVVIGSDLKNFDATVGLALHEASHIKLTDFSILSSMYVTNSDIQRQMQSCAGNMFTYGTIGHVKSLLNWIEDRRIDYYIYTVAPGYRLYYEAMYDKYFNDKIITKALRSKQTRSETIDNYFFHIINFTNANRDLSALKGLREIWNIINLRQIDRLKNTKESYELALKVYSIILNNIQVDNSKPDEDTNKDNIERDASSDTELEDLSYEELKALDSAIEEQKKFVDNKVKKQGSLNRKEGKRVDAIQESGTDIKQTNVGTDARPIMIDNIIINKFNEHILLEDPLNIFCSSQFNKMRQGREVGPDVREQTEFIESGIALGKRLGAKLQVRNEDRTLKHTRLETGKIDRRLVSELGFGNESVFHKLVTERFKKYLIHISIDASGSMTGPKFHEALRSAVAIAQAASMTTGIRVQISFRGTSQDDISTILYAYDSYTDKPSKIRNLFPYITTFGTTPEGIAFSTMINKLKQDAGSDECIFINYSDGMPSQANGTPYSYDGIEFTKKIVGKMQQQGIHIISMFIDRYSNTSDSRIVKQFKHMYGKESKFVDTSNMIQIASIMNEKFLEINQ